MRENMMKEKSGAGFPGEGNETVCWGPKRGIDFMRWTPEGTHSGGNLQLSTRGGIIFYISARAAAAGVALRNGMIGVSERTLETI